MERRTFLNGMAGWGVAGAAAGSTLLSAGQSQASGDAPAKLPRVTDPGELRGGMLYRKLGRTGERVSAIGLGGSHLSNPTLAEEDAIRILHQAVDGGITFMDNSWDYSEGRSEMRMGKALAQNKSRDKVFLMTKIDGRTKETAARQIEDSLSRLQTDHVDLLQFHEVLRFDDADRIFAEGGALEAVLEAKKAGKLRFIGFTGHKDPRVHLYMLDVARQHDFHFDTVMMPLNVMDAHFRSFAQLVLPRLVQEQIGVLSMKPFGGGEGIILKSKTVEPMECMHFVLNLPTNVMITGIDKPEILTQAFEAAKTFRPMSEAQVAAVMAKTRDVARTGKYELFKTTSHFDTTARHADWLGADTPAVQKLAPQLPG